MHLFPSGNDYFNVDHLFFLAFFNLHFTNLNFNYILFYFLYKFTSSRHTVSHCFQFLIILSSISTCTMSSAEACAAEIQIFNIFI